VATAAIPPTAARRVEFLMTLLSWVSEP